MLVWRGGYAMILEVNGESAPVFLQYKKRGVDLGVDAIYKLGIVVSKQSCMNLVSIP
jgi:hypothetical protein